MYITFVDGDVLAVSSSYASGDEYSSPVVSPEKEQVSTLREIMWAMNEVDLHYTHRNAIPCRVQGGQLLVWLHRHDDDDSLSDHGCATVHHHEKVSLSNTLVSMTLPWVFGYAFFIFLIVQYMRGIPRDLDEVAMLDGCSKIGVLFKILIPIVRSKPLLCHLQPHDNKA